jgi:hypothetical protein
LELLYHDIDNNLLKMILLKKKSLNDIFLGSHALTSQIRNGAQNFNEDSADTCG